jgi:hypothetical protein
MLVDTVKLVEHPEVMGAVAIPSMVRLQVLDDCSGPRVDPANLPVKFTLGRRPRPKDRELRLGLHRRRQGAGVRDGKRVGEVIESAAEAVGDLSRIERDAVRHFARKLHPADVLTSFGFRIVIFPDSIGIGFEPGGDLRFERIQVFDRPIELLSVARRHALTSTHDA